MNTSVLRITNLYYIMYTSVLSFTSFLKSQKIEPKIGYNAKYLTLAGVLGYAQKQSDALLFWFCILAFVGLALPLKTSNFLSTIKSKISFSEYIAVITLILQSIFSLITEQEKDMDCYVIGEIGIHSFGISCFFVIPFIELIPKPELPMGIEGFWDYKITISIVMCTVGIMTITNYRVYEYLIFNILFSANKKVIIWFAFCSIFLVTISPKLNFNVHAAIKRKIYHFFIFIVFFIPLYFGEDSGLIVLAVEVGVCGLGVLECIRHENYNSGREDGVGSFFKNWKDSKDNQAIENSSEFFCSHITLLMSTIITVKRESSGFGKYVGLILVCVSDR